MSSQRNAGLDREAVRSGEEWLKTSQFRDPIDATKESYASAQSDEQRAKAYAKYQRIVEKIREYFKGKGWKVDVMVIPWSPERGGQPQMYTPDPVIRIFVWS